MAALPWVFGLLSLAVEVALVGGTQHDCTFPKYLQSTHSGVWLNRVRDQGRFNTKQHLIEITFSGGTMAADVIYQFDATDIEDPYSRKCLNQTGDNFIVSHTPRGKAPTFMCMNFYRQSSAVVFLRQTYPYSTVETVRCDGLYTENWPLVMKQSEQGQVVPVVLDHLVGGYDMTPVGDLRLKWGEQCDTTTVPPPRMEVACLPRDYINLDFQVISCIPPNLLMTKLQKLIVLGLWEEFGFVFMTLKATGRNNYWCARFEKDANIADQMNLVLFLDLVCDSTKTLGSINRMEFELKKIKPENVNDSPMTSMGRLPTSYQGRWLRMDGETMINISQSTIFLPEYGLFELPQDPKVKESELLRVPLYSTVRNGCAPKALCLEMGLRNANVVRYKLGTIVEMVKGQTYTDPHAQFCRNDLFVQEKYYTLINPVRKEESDCGMGSSKPWFQYFTNTPTGHLCEGEVKITCNSDKMIQISHNTCPNWPTFTNNHVCLVSFLEKGGGRVVITKHELPEDSRDFCCWIFRKSENEMFYAHAYDCDANTAYNYEMFEEGKDHLTLFKIKNENQSCASSTLPATTPMPMPEYTEAEEPELKIYTVAEDNKSGSQYEPINAATLPIASPYTIGTLIFFFLLETV